MIKAKMSYEHFGLKMCYNTLGLYQMMATAVLIKKFRHFIWSSHPSPSFGVMS